MEITSRIDISNLPSDRKEIEVSAVEALQRIWSKYPDARADSITILVGLTRPQINLIESDEVKQ